MKIKEIKIKGFRSIKEELHIKDFGNILSLVGKNNSGKSSILNALRLFWGDTVINEKDFTYGGTNNSKELTISILFTNVLNSDLFKYSLLTLPNKNTLIRRMKNNFTSLEALEVNDILEKLKKLDFEENELEYLYDEFIDLLKIELNNNTILIKYKAGLSNGKIIEHYLKESGDEDKNYFKKDIGKPTLLFIGDNRNFNEEENGSKGSFTAQLIQDLDIKKEEIQISSTSSCISIDDLEFLIEGKFEEKTDEIGVKISDNFKKYYKSDFNEVKLNTKYSGISQSNFKINAQIKEPITGEFIDLNNLGAGLRSIYILSLLKAYNELKDGNDTIIIIEEPELYLHPELQKEMSGTLNEISKEHTVFFTTHSPLLLNKLNIENISNIYFDEILKTTKIQNAKMEIICNDLGYNSLDIINKEKILFVEGTSDINIFGKIIDKFYNGILEKIKIIAIGGCSNLPKYATLNFIGESPILLENSLIILDRDYESGTYNVNTEINRKNNFKNGLRRIIDPTIVNKYNDNIIHITSGHSLENFFLDFSIINTIFSGVNLDEAILRREFRAFADGHGYFDSNEFRNHYNKINNISGFFDGVEDSTIDLINIRGHNLMHYLIYKCYGSDYTNITGENELDFCTRYINASSETNFQGLLDFLNGINLFDNNKNY